MAIFRWEDIDHKLVSLKLTELAEEMQRQIKADENRIWFENLGNLNGNAVPSLVLQMKQVRTDEMARKTYEIYCDVWKKQGYAKSAPFVRAVFARAIVTVLHARASAIASQFALFARRTSFPTILLQAHVGSLKLNMQRMEDRWRRRLEIEAKECEHADRIASRSLPFVPSEHGSAKQSPSVRVAEANQQPACHESSQSVKPPPSPPNRTKPGRRRRLADSFVVCAGELWRKAIGESKTKGSNGQLREIASVLDAAKYLPPAVYLEGKFARELKAFNSQHSKSKEAGPILTWSQLVAHADKDHLQGMRRLLSR